MSSRPDGEPSGFCASGPEGSEPFRRSSDTVARETYHIAVSNPRIDSRSNWAETLGQSATETKFRALQYETKQEDSGRTYLLLPIYGMPFLYNLILCSYFALTTCHHRRKGEG